MLGLMSFPFTALLAQLLLALALEPIRETNFRTRVKGDGCVDLKDRSEHGGQR